MAGKPHVEEPSFMDKIPLTYRDYPGEVEPSESVQISVAHLDPPPEVPHTAHEPAAKSAKKEN